MMMNNIFQRVLAKIHQPIGEFKTYLMGFLISDWYCAVSFAMFVPFTERCT